MQNIPGIRIARALLLCSLALTTACDAPEPITAPFASHLEMSTGASLIECPSPEPQSTHRRMSFLGGLVTLDGNAVLVPLGALLGAVDIAIETPASQHMRVDFRANGREHWQFLAPLMVTIDYSRCPASAIGDGPLSVWYIDSETGELLQNMGGIDNRLLRQITFVTDHFSGYAIAN